MKKYVFKPYSKSYPILFEKEKERIAKHLIENTIIEHVGSTAVINLGGKGIIDIAIAAKKEEIDDIAKELQILGYELRRNGSTPDRLYFEIILPDEEEGKRKYHVHLTYNESRDWITLIGFRDFLRSHPEVVKEYEEIKKNAALEAKEIGEKYRKIKMPFIERINDLFR